MAIALTTPSGDVVARFASAEDMVNTFLAVCTVMDAEIVALKAQLAEVTAERSGLAPIPVMETLGVIGCNPHPDAPHGFDRNASHGAGRYVCECEGWIKD